MHHDCVTEGHVLIIEDEPDFASLLHSILTKGGYTAAIADNWTDALKELDDKTPDLITLDMNMPGKSGVFVYRDIKANRKVRDIPVVVVTGLTHDDEEMENVIRSVMELEPPPHPVAYVEKPVDGPNFLGTVREALLSSKCENC
jgi:CheY-like chemotaxis protein